MQYDTIEELTLELALYPNKKLDILKDCANKCKYGWFTIAKDGNCALFDENGDLDDISKVKSINENMILKDIEKINIPDSITSIGNYAFAGCESLMSVTIPNIITSIRHGTFMDCINLTSMTIPDSVTYIGSYAFYNCNRLTNVIIGNDVTYIGYNAFSSCNNLKELILKGKTIEEVKSMENYPFGIKITSIIK